jgi:hypothetical protein
LWDLSFKFINHNTISNDYIYNEIWILIVSHIESIENRLFFNIQCHSIDFLLRFCLTMDQWLTASVSIERAYITVKGIKFNKKKTRSTAKWTILGLVIVTIATNIHDPIYRSLFDEIDNDEKRIWCILKYPSAIRIMDSVMNMFHLIIPFIINLISAIIIIIINVRQRATVQTKQKYIKVLKEQIEQHKNLLIGPCVLIILNIPRLSISFASDCIKSASNSWLFLVGYFISFISLTLAFILFVYHQQYTKKHLVKLLVNIEKYSPNVYKNVKINIYIQTLILINNA